MYTPIQLLYAKIKPDIERKCAEFDEIRERNDELELFQELVFCLLTPQSNAHRAWDAVCRLRENNLLLHGDSAVISPIVRAVRFHNNKSAYILNARKTVFGKLGYLLASHENDLLRRDMLVRAVKGLGLKEASHFLRNIGYYHECAILDRHILRQLVDANVLSAMPTSLSPIQYFEIEQTMLQFARAQGIPLAHLDMVFWYMANGELFK